MNTLLAYLNPYARARHAEAAAVQLAAELAVERAHASGLVALADKVKVLERHVDALRFGGRRGVI